MIVRNIIRGEAGTTWVNDTELVLYQFAADLVNTCGVCLQFHHAISSPWPIPIHFNCRCMQFAIPPGAMAPFPFLDYRMVLAKMDAGQQAAAIGSSNAKLLRAGIATWADIVTASRVRDFAEVVALLKLTGKQLLAARVRQADADRALATAGLSEEEHARRQSREQREILAAPDKTLAALVMALSATKPAIVAGIGAAGVMTAVSPGHAEDLAAAIAAWRPKKKIEPTKS